MNKFNQTCCRHVWVDEWVYGECGLKKKELFHKWINQDKQERRERERGGERREREEDLAKDVQKR